MVNAHEWATEQYQAFCRRYAELKSPDYSGPGKENVPTVILTRDVFEHIKDWLADGKKSSLTGKQESMLNSYISAAVAESMLAPESFKTLSARRLFCVRTALEVVGFVKMPR